MLSKGIQALEERLQPVSEPLNGAENAPQSIPETAVPLASDLRNISSEIEGMYTRVLRMTNALAI